MEVRDNKAHDHSKKNANLYQKATQIPLEPQYKGEEPLMIKDNDGPSVRASTPNTNLMGTRFTYLHGLSAKHTLG